MHTACLYRREKRPLYGRHSSQRGTVGEELFHEVYHNILLKIQPKTAGLPHVLFVLLRLLYCIPACVYCASLGSQTHDLSDSEMLNPGGQVSYARNTEITSLW